MIPTSPAAVPTATSLKTRSEPSRPIYPIAPSGALVTSLVSLAGGYLIFLDERRTDEYAGLLLIAALVVGVIAAVPGAIAAAISAWTLRWHSRRAMWIAGLASAAAMPILLWLMLNW